MVSKKIKLRLIDLIGKKIKVVDAKNRSLIGIEGVVLDETKNTIIVESNGIKTLLKEQIVIEVDGQVFKPVVARPWEVKKRWKKWRKLFRGEEDSLE